MKNSYEAKINLKILTASAVMLLFLSQAQAQCGCDHTVPLSVEIFDGAGVSPGEVICVDAGTRDRLHFQNIIGTEASPIIIKNCGGQVVINGTGSGGSNVPLKLGGNKHFRVTGTGDAAYFYGFKVGGEAYASVDAGQQATNFEFDHIEVVSSGFAGFMLKTDPNGTGENVRPNAPDAVNGGFTMYDVSVHDCYIHDILPDGEGIYLGNSFWHSGVPSSGQYPHSIYGAKIYNNTFDKTGREAIQAGAVVEGLEIYNNKIYNYGWNNPSDSQNNGMQIGQGSSGRVYNNYINNEANAEGSRAIYVMGIGDNYVYNNVVKGAGTPSGEGGSVIINANLKTAPLPGDPGYDTGGFIGGAYFMNNTIIDTRGVAEVFGTYLNNAPDNVLYNNLVISSNSNWDGITGSNWTKADNIWYATVGEADFTDPANDDYSLQSTSGAIDVGTDVSSYGVNIDYTGASRPVNGIYDAGAYEYGGVSGNNPPVLSSIGDQTVEEDATANVNVSASDADGDNVTLTATSLPAFASFIDNGDNTGTLTISPQQGDAGTYTGVQITADDGNGGQDSETITITVTDDTVGGSGGVVYRVNAGGVLQSDPEMDWGKDKQTDPSPYFDDANCVNYTTGSDTWSGTNTTSAPDNIFGPYRYDNGATWGDRQRWDFPVSNGDYKVHLYFKAIGTAAGSNVFDVAIEGTVVLDEYDIFATAGGSGIPVEETFVVNVSDGNLDIDLPSITTGKSIINGIEIVSVTNNPPVLSTIGNQSVDEDATANVNVSATDADGDNLTLTATNLPAFASFTDNGDNTGTLTISPQQGDAGTYTGVQITADDGNGGQDSETFTITVNDTGGSGSVVYRVNAGGVLQSDTEMDWGKDKQTDPSPYFDDVNCVNYTTGSDTWSGTNNTSAPDNIFGPYRYDNGATWGDRQHWDFSVNNGDYEVRLYFNDKESASAGSNVFDVAIEGTVVLDEYDIYATAGGGNIPVEETFVVNVSDGNLDIDLPSITTGKSIISGIEILTSGSSSRVGEMSDMVTERNAVSKVYPNPVGDHLNINLKEWDDSADVEIYLLDNSGKLLTTRFIRGLAGSKIIELDVSGLQLTPGIYYLKISGNSYQEVRKILKE